MDNISPPSSNYFEFNTGAVHDDEEDPLGILEGASRRDHCASRSGAATLEREAPVALSTCKVDFERGDPREAIDAILRHSKEVRDRVFSRQVRCRARLVLHCYCSCLFPSEFLGEIVALLSV